MIHIHIHSATAFAVFESIATRLQEPKDDDFVLELGKLHLQADKEAFVARCNQLAIAYNDMLGQFQQQHSIFSVYTEKMEIFTHLFH